MKFFIINKNDFFSPRRRRTDVPDHRLPHNTTFQDLPEAICVCSNCFFEDSRQASFINQRAIENGREVIDADELPLHDRPGRCHLCGRGMDSSHVPTQGGTERTAV